MNILFQYYLILTNKSHLKNLAVAIWKMKVYTIFTMQTDQIVDNCTHYTQTICIFFIQLFAGVLRVDIFLYRIVLEIWRIIVRGDQLIELYQNSGNFTKRTEKNPNVPNISIYFHIIIN